MSPLGETLQRARLAKGTTIEDAERVTRIPRKYLEALELENFGILPAPVYARGFLRSYAGYLGLDAGDLLPFFPVGHVEEAARLEPLPEVHQPRTWNMSGLVGMGVVAFLILLVIALYSVGKEDSNPSFAGVSNNAATTGQNSGSTTTTDDGATAGNAGPAVALPDFVGGSLQDAIAVVERAGASYIVVQVSGGDVPTGQVVDQSPAPGTAVGAGDLVTISTAK